MSLDRIRTRLASTPFFTQLRSFAGEVRSGETLRINGAVGSLPAFAVIQAQIARKSLVVAVLPTDESAAYLQSDLEQIAGEQPEIIVFPATGTSMRRGETVADSAGAIARADVLQRLAEGFDGILVTSIEALIEPVPLPESVQSESLTLEVGNLIGPDTLVECLIGQNFELVDFVAEPGEAALRGGILDVYPFTGGYPLRFEFFGDEIDSIREFDPQSQRSVSRRTSARIVPNLADSARNGEAVSLAIHLPEETLLAFFDDERFIPLADEWKAAVDETLQLLDGAILLDSLKPFPRFHFGTFASPGDASLLLQSTPQPPFNGDIPGLRDHLAELKRNDYEAFLLCDSLSQEARLRDLLTKENDEIDAALAVESLHEGFIVPEAQIAVYTDHQVFNRYHRPTARKRKKVVGGLSLRDVQNLTPGDFVVHIDHGIGRFAGLHKIRVKDSVREAVRLEFHGSDELFVNVSALHKLHKYTGKEGHQPSLTRLGTGQWEKVKNRVRKRVKDIARDLIQLYAKRKASPGFAFSGDSTWQREMEASFKYEDTPDQAQAATTVKEDMEQAMPMDRLVCGDVGFGKTEIAIRAAFKAVQDGKQVAVLVPTTLLAMQHFETFSRRLAKYPVKIAQMSRLVPAPDLKKVQEGMKDGTIDIVIGTQRLAGKNIKFKDLGLLVIDEEQRFGVTVKERLRKMRAEVDTLILTATPIPRTLQFSLMGVRDLSTINTPPPNRRPVQTEIHTFNRDLIRDAILYEVNRGGQVFYVHNRVQNIEEHSAMIQALAPNVRVKIAYGQMPPEQLESVMHGFIQHEFDVLVSTNIVESGIDVANANTIIIANAQNFGLSDLHQLRGRVGRSDVNAFCYLLVPSVHTLTREARMRLKAVEEFSDLGSGFSIAMRDLDIRGAGAMLGAEQSGFIEDIGYETYHKILEDAVAELRREEFADLFPESEQRSAVESTIDVEVDAFLPVTYVADNTERMNLYRRLADKSDEKNLSFFRQELEDRFGSIPPEVESLLAVATMKPLAEALRLPRVAFKNQRLFLTFPDPEADKLFYEQDFHPLLARLGNLPNRYVMKESTGGKLRAIVQEVSDLNAALAVLRTLQA